MKFTPRPRSGRPSFTLVELLVVIAIIAILAGLITATVMKFMFEGPRLETRAEMVNLTAGLEKFKLDVGCYPPSRLMLREDCKYNLNGSQLEQDSITFLQKLLGRAFVIGQPIDWNGDGTITQNTAWTLEGDECLVFCLQGPKGRGFPVAGNKVLGPYFNFQAGRVQASGRPGGFKNYLDPFGHPYAYLSAWTGANLYSPYTAAGAAAAPGAGATDCPTLAVSPYYAISNSVTQYYRPASYQIISAGTNKLFGPGGSWVPQNAEAINANGKDDMTNFYDSLMSVPSN